MSARTLTIDIYSDVMCPWCAIGYGQLQKALGQLEGEIAQNGWLTCAAQPDIIFGRANEHKWTAAIRALGIEPSLLSSDAGRA